MLAIEAPKPGTVIHWHISDILTRLAGDMTSMYACMRRCTECGADWDFYRGKDWYRLTEGSADHNCYDRRPLTLDEKWEYLIEQKRGDRQYPELVESIAQAGFTTHVNAFIDVEADHPHLRICDGHHRLAAAIELGLETVPVKVYTRPTYS